jgi:putative colanic acid biosynthesis acetyltransferase WcaF
MSNGCIDVGANRRAQKWTLRNQFWRILWVLALPFFSLSPRPLWGWRRFLLRLFGARIGKYVHVYPSVRVAIPWNLSVGEFSAIGDHAVIYSLGPISIGNRTTISQGAHLCAGTHDYRNPSMPLLKMPIIIGDDIWICADAFVGPGVTVGDGAVVGARAVAVRDIPPWTVAVGNPAQVIGVRRLDGRKDDQA